MLRPRMATRRPYSAETVIACWMRWMFEAKVAMITRRSARANTSWNVRPTMRSEGTCPGRSMFVTSVISSSTPSSPRRSNPEKSVIRPSMGVGSSL